MQKKVIALILASLMMLAVFGGCGQQAADSNTTKTAVSEGSSTTTQPSGSTAAAEKPSGKLIVWSYMNEGEPLQAWQQSVTDRYKQLYPDVQVDMVYLGRDILTVLQTKLQDTTAADFPDLISIGDTALAPLAKDGHLYDLTNDLTTPAYDSDKTWGDTFIKNVIDIQKIDGKTYFIPEGVYTHGFFYDKVMFKKLGIEVPKTWDEFINVCETLKKNNITPFSLDGTVDIYNQWWYTRFAERLAGPDELAKAAVGDASFKDNPAFLEAAKYVADFSKKGYFQKGFEGSAFPAAQALFTQGVTGMLFCGGWIPTEMSAQTPPTMEMSMFALPELPNSKSVRAEELWGNAFGIMNTSKNKVAGIAWLKLFSSYEMAPAKSAIKNPSPLVGAPPVKELDQMENILANATTVSPAYDGLAAMGDWTNKIFGPLSTKLITGQITPEEYISSLDKETKAYYKK